MAGRYKEQAMKPLLERDADPDPLRMFQAWFAEARDTGMELPEAVALATATPDGAPSARMVLLKGADEAGLVFFTSYTSRKAPDPEGNPRAALPFPRPPPRPPGPAGGAAAPGSPGGTPRHLPRPPPA